VPAETQVVLLLVNQQPIPTAQAVDAVKPDVVQFHGGETAQWLGLLKQSGAKQELWKVRFDLTTRQESNYSRLPATRKRIARILTVMTERQREADAATADAEKAS
jgi:ribosomal protein L29